MAICKLWHSAFSIGVLRSTSYLHFFFPHIHVFYKNVVDKNIEAKICLKFKNILRTWPASVQVNMTRTATKGIQNFNKEGKMHLWLSIGLYVCYVFTVKQLLHVKIAPISRKFLSRSVHRASYFPTLCDNCARQLPSKKQTLHTKYLWRTQIRTSEAEIDQKISTLSLSWNLGVLIKKKRVEEHPLAILCVVKGEESGTCCLLGLLTSV